jgi:DNA-binding response OmpR family regulator
MAVGGAAREKAARTAAAGTVMVAVPDGGLATPIAEALAAERLMPVLVFSRSALLAFAADQTFAAIVVDPCLDPKADPARLLSEIRAATPVPLVVLGYAPGEGAPLVDHGIAGLLGTSAPPTDVVGTVVAAIANSDGDAEVVSHGDLVVDTRNFEAWCGVDVLDLTPTELRLLAALVGAHGDLVGKRVLQEAAWGTSSGHDDNRLQAHIRRLRTKLSSGDGEGSAMLKTVRGLGFRLESPQLLPRSGVHEPTEIVEKASRYDR